MERIRTEGMNLVEAGRRFVLRGVSYGPFRTNPQGEPFPEKSTVERDLRLVRELGANALRVYHVPPAWLCDLCESFGLRLVVGIPWSQHIRFLDSSSTRREIRGAIREGALALRAHSNVLALLLGNEISPQIVRWYGPRRIERFLSQLADEARQADSQALLSYANFPMTEYLELDFLELACFNVYLHRCEDLRRYLSRLQNLAAFRPLVLSEFGIDSIREGPEEQGRILGETLDTVDELGCAGSIVFSFTDEWHTGGYDVEGWAFGLVTPEREPKPAFDAVRERFSLASPRLPDPAPRVSVVICAYNAERTMRECLESLRQLRYPDFEVIVVDDGSTDSTKAIAEEFPEFRLISQENRGLSAARNVGIEAATGEIVAYTDSDCAVHPDWLGFLVLRLTAGDLPGVGGPNLPPPEDDWVPEAVARSPGGPTHVLLTDEEAEHVPGCNMAFWRERLVAVGGFDPVFHAAGDDVDICWRLQNEGLHIGYAPSALVWHRRRSTVGAYLKQQRGYGEAESMLYFKHPYRFNELGQSRWLGRIYSDLGPGLLGGRPRINSGPFGSGLFQTLYEPSSSLLRHLPVTLEWNGAALVLIAVSLLATSLGVPLWPLGLFGLGLLAISVAQAVSTALRVDVAGLPRVRARCLIALLNYLGPLVRTVARYRGRVAGSSQVRPMHFAELHSQPEIDLLRRRFTLTFWNETSLEKETCLSALLDFVRPRKYAVVLDDGWQPWDLSVLAGAWVRGEIKILVENHGAEKRQVDVEVRLRHNTPAWILHGLCAVVVALGLASGTWLPVVVGAGLAALAEGSFAASATRLGSSLYHAVDIAFRRLTLTALRKGRSGDREALA